MLQDVQWVITALTKVICDFKLHPANEHAVAAETCAREWDRLKSEKILTAPTLTNILWTGEYKEFTSQLVALMVHYDLAVLIRSTPGLFFTSSTKMEYLVPSLTSIANTPTTTLGMRCYFHVPSPLKGDERPKAVVAYDELRTGCLREGDFYALVSQWALASTRHLVCHQSGVCTACFTPSHIAPHVLPRHGEYSV